MRLPGFIYGTVHLGNLLAAHEQPQSLQQIGVLIQTFRFGGSNKSLGSIKILKIQPASAIVLPGWGLQGPVAQTAEHLPFKRSHRFFSLHRLRSILCFINNLGNLLAAHEQPQSLQQIGVLIQF